jgi:hypothetical protein
VRSGRRTTVDGSNLQLRCRAHNEFEEQQWSGPNEQDLIREIGPIYDSVLSCVSNRFQASGFDAAVATQLGPGPGSQTDHD